MRISHSTKPHFQRPPTGILLQDSYLLDALKHITEIDAPRYLDQEPQNWSLSRHLGKNDDFNFLTLRYKYPLISDNEKKSRFVVEGHFFNTPRKPKIDHLHEVATAVMNMHPDGRIRTKAHTMHCRVLKEQLANTVAHSELEEKTLSYETMDIAFGQPYAIEDYRGTTHLIETSIVPRVTLIIGDITNGFHSHQIEDLDKRKLHLSLIHI